MRGALNRGHLKIPMKGAVQGDHEGREGQGCHERPRRGGSHELLIAIVGALLVKKRNTFKFQWCFHQ